MSKTPIRTQSPEERAFLVGVEINNKRSLLSVEDSLKELALLAETAGLVYVGHTQQRLERPDPKTFVGAGKVEEIRDLSEDLEADVIVFDEELSPRHQRELERIMGDRLRVLDRTALILDIFAQHAHTREGALQVELAQYEYRLPRLTRAWTHLARQAGGGGGRAGGVGGVGLRGPGETQLEVDRQVIGQRITRLKEELEKVRAHRKRYRTRRSQAKIPTVALVGYTNSGKSTLLNTLSNAQVFVADKLFATLDPTTRRIELPSGRHALLTDTVGFIQKLPTLLVAAFRATLEEIAESDLLLHVVDITHPQALEQAQAVRETLDEIHVRGVPMVTALNKIDLLPDSAMTVEWVDEFERAIPISAKTGGGIQALLAAMDDELFDRLTPIQVRIPYNEGKLINLFHEVGVVEGVQHTAEGVELRGYLPQWSVDKFVRFQMRAPAAVGSSSSHPPEREPSEPFQP
jgi:GTP-binding protein HflX